MKNLFEEPKMEIIRYDVNDVMCTSPNESVQNVEEEYGY